MSKATVEGLMVAVTMFVVGVFVSLCVAQTADAQGFPFPGPGQPPAGPPPTPVSWTDDFNRADNTDPSVGAPDPPGAYVKIDSNATCDWIIESNILKLDMDAGHSCSFNTPRLIADEPLGTVDQCSLWNFDGNFNFASGTGAGWLFRVNDTAQTGNQYNMKCDNNTCSSISVEVESGGGFLGAVSNFACTGVQELPTAAPGDNLAACVTGTGEANTRFRIWNLGATVTDREDPSTWGAPDCDQTPGAGSYPSGTTADTGLFTGLRVYLGSGTAGKFWRWDDWSISDSNL